MKKLFLFSFVSLFLALLTASVVNAVPDLNETWSYDGKPFESQQSGNSISIKGEDGIIVFTGTITGNTVEGKQYLTADGCPDLNKYVPASGTISEDGTTITSTYTSLQYDTSGCFDLPGTEQEYTISYAKTSSVVSPSASASPFPSQPTQQADDETACHESCQSSYDSCTSECSPQETASETDDFERWLKECASRPLPKTREELEEQERQDEDPNSPCYTGRRFVCDKAPDDTCLPGTARFEQIGEPKKSGTAVKSSKEGCFTACEQVRSSCDQSCRESGQADNNSNPPEKSPVGVSSRDFRALARANAEYQKAQADLEKLKADQIFSDKYNTQLENVFKPTEKPPENYLQAVRENLEWGKEALEVYQAANELQDYLDNAKFESYGRVSLITDVGNGIITFTDLVADGVSVENASTKAIIDTAAPSVFYLFPPLKAADMIATLPDDFLAIFGIPEDNLVRVGTGFLADNSPSAFVEITTDAMIKTGNWTNVGGALQVAWDDVKAAEGLGEKAKATLDLVGTAVGAIPVAIVMNVRDNISAVFSGVKDAGNIISNISSWFTYPE